MKSLFITSFINHINTSNDLIMGYGQSDANIELMAKAYYKTYKQWSTIFGGKSIDSYLKHYVV